jgi:hypothetical protein
VDRKGSTDLAERINRSARSVLPVNRRAASAHDSNLGIIAPPPGVQDVHARLMTALRDLDADVTPLGEIFNGRKYCAKGTDVVRLAPQGSSTATLIVYVRAGGNTTLKGIRDGTYGMCRRPPSTRAAYRPDRYTRRPGATAR